MMAATFADARWSVVRFMCIKVGVRFVSLLSPYPYIAGGKKMKKNLLGIVLLLSHLTAVAASDVTIAPSGDLSGVTDQLNIQGALDAAGTNKQAKIKLAAGTFYLNGGVGVTGFRGTLQGAGQGTTMVIALGSGVAANRGSVFLFADGDATIKNLSIEVPDGSSYLDSSPGLFTSDGGAAIDIFGGSASVKNVEILSNGPFGSFGPESLESGVLLHNCDGDFELKNSRFEGVKRSFVFNPEAQSNCDLTISGNHFENNRGGVFLLGGTGGFKGGNRGKATITDNTFNDTLVNDILGFLVEFAVTVKNNEIAHPNPSGNSAIEFDFGSGDVDIIDNVTDGQYFLPSIYLFSQIGGSAVISRNTVNGASRQGFGAIGVDTADDVTIKHNDLTANSLIPGWVVPGFTTSGAYLIFDSTNVTIKNERLPPSSQLTCQVLHVPTIDPSNRIDSNLIECASADPPPGN
jgi:hypothetical protein